MREWLKTFLATMAVLLGASVLYLWAAPLTGPTGRNVVFTETSTIDTLAIKGNIFTLHQQPSAPTTPATDDWLIYALSTGVHIRDDLGNIIGPVGTGGGGGGTVTTQKLPVQAASTADVTLSNPGTAIFDGVTLATGQRLLVRQQATGSQNGIYTFATSSTPLTRATDADTSGEFLDAFSVVVQSGTLYGGVSFYFANIGAFTLGTTTPTFAVQSWGAKGDTLAARSTIATSVPSGTIGSDSNGRVPWNRAGSYAAHGGLSAASQITPTAQTMGIENIGAGNLLLTSGNPRITGCSAAADGIHLYLVGLSTTKTVTIPDGNGVLLAGALGSGAGAAGGVTIGLAPGGTSAEFRCNGTTTIWEQVSVVTLQQAKNAGASITNAEIEASGVRIGGASDYCILYGNTTKCYCAGVQCPGTTVSNLVLATNGAKPTCAVGERFKVWPTAGGAGVADTLEHCRKDGADAYDWGSLGAGGGGAVTTQIPLQLMTVSTTDANAFVDTIDGTSLDYSGVRYIDGVTGTSYWKVKLPTNLNATPAWNLVLVHKATSGSGGNTILTVAAKDYPTATTFDAALTALHTAATFAVSTSAQTTITTLSGTSYDGTEPIAAGNILIVSISRVGGSGSDSLSADWLLIDASLRISVD